jgi:cellulose synthase/poly-beta-1,6-N-acetylglucosamine synthase-like glycosyltransferase
VWPDVPTIDWGGALVGVLIAYSVAGFIAHMTLGLSAMAEVRRQRRRQLIADPLNLLGSDHAPAISVLLPACDEAATIADAVHAYRRLDYPALEIVVVNDGSTDGTLDRLIAEFGLRPSKRTPIAGLKRAEVRGVYSSPHYSDLTLVDIVRGGSRARAASFALAYARNPLVLLANAETVLERETLVHLAVPFHEDESVAAVVGVARPWNGCVIEGGSVTYCGQPANRLARYQVVEHLRDALSGRLAWGNLDSLLAPCDAPALFSREAVSAAGGFRGGNVGDDVDLCMRLQRHARKRRRGSVVRCVSRAVAWSRVPENLPGLLRRRARRDQALGEALSFNRNLLLDGRLAFQHGPAYLFHLVFDLIGPLVEACGQIALVTLLVTGDVDLSLFVIYFSIFVVGGTIPTLMAVGLEPNACPRFQSGKDLEGLSLYGLLENLGYRQAMGLWRIVGLWNAMFSRRAWGMKPLRGAAAQPAEAEEQEAA